MEINGITQRFETFMDSLMEQSILRQKNIIPGVLILQLNQEDLTR